MIARNDLHARPLLTSALALVIALAGLAGCSNPTSSAAALGKSCATNNDCPTGQSCSAGFCLAKECDDATGKACPAGKKCVAGACQSITAVIDATGDSSPQSDAIIGTDAVTADPDTTPGTDTVSNEKGAACLACKVDADCGDAAFQCITLLNGTFCAKKCTASSDCPTAFKCDKADTKAANNNCLPPNYSCDGCLVTPCDAGMSCVTATGKCAVVKQQCDTCNAQLDCADGLKCVKLGTAKVCAPTCDNGAACPDTSTCQKTVVGNVCAFQAATCCYGSSCTVADACSKCSDKCFGGTCVECLSDSQCTGGKCDPNAHTCITGGACQAPTPIKLVDGSCVECTNDTHCASSTVGTKCDLGTHKCGASGNQTNECKPCVDPYPGCVQINGTWSCVECSTDADCAAKNAGTCNSTTYTCAGTVSGGTGPKTGTCKQDADCQNAGTTTFTLLCDTASGLCFDTAGKCDNLSAFCNATKGSSCVQPSAVGIPGLPGGGTGANPGEGVCSCGATAAGGGATTNPMCKLFAPTCDCAKNPTDPVCTASLIGDCCSGGSGGTGGGLPFDLSCLTPAPNAPDCFGSLSCTCDLLSSVTGGGAAAPHTCGTGSGLGGP
jgi:hypothetical protein